MNDIWEEFLKIVKQEVGSRVVETWLKAVCLHRWDSLQKIMYVQAPNSFVRDWIKTHYMVLFNVHLSRLLNVDAISIVFIDAQESNKVASKTEVIPACQIPSSELMDMLPARRNIKQRCHINRNYQFDTFVVGPSNSLAYAAAHAITEKPGKLYNPLFIYGGSGLGKTHLLHAICNEIRQKNKKAEVLYQTTDRFVNEFIHAIRFDKVHQFQIKYKNIDVLLIDDVQFISNKEQTQEAFFHIFNSLYESHKQIVFSSDSYPADIKGLAERLSSRLEWGLVADIQIPPIETKIAILKRKAEMNNVQLSDEVAHYIASLVVSNIRELEGSFIRVMAFASLMRQPITLDLAKKVLLREAERPSPTINFERIVECISHHYRYSISELRSENRNKHLSLVRQIAMYLMKKLTNKSLLEIGHFLGRKDHTTVLHAIDKIEQRLANDVELGGHIKKIEHEIINSY